MANNNTSSDEKSPVNSEDTSPKYDQDDINVAMAIIKAAAKGKFEYKFQDFFMFSHHCCFLVNVIPP